MTHHHHHGLNGCEWCDECSGRHGLWGAFVLGLGIVSVGMILILNNFGMVDGGLFLPYWPVLLIILGLSHLVRRGTRKFALGLSLIAIGAIIQLGNLGLIALGIGDLWPILLVIFGANLVVCGFERARRRSVDATNDELPPVV